MIRLGLVGHPVEHSLSPRLHAVALQAAGLSGEYALYPVRPRDLDALRALLQRVRGGEIQGLNVTIPHKQNVLGLVDELTPGARAIGAVNAVCPRAGRLIGENTDAPGFLADLRRFLGSERLASLQRRSALVLGAGGSARAVVHALLGAGWRVLVAARRLDQARQIAAHFDGHADRISGIGLSADDLRRRLSDLALIVNATPAGMWPYVDVSPWPEDLAFPPAAAVYDLVYNPRQTFLVTRARAAGLHATTGTGMLIEQAALSFELWTERIADRKAMLAALDPA